MIACPRKTVASLLVVLIGALAGCTNYFEIPIETPIQPKLDITTFQRVLVAGFISGGSEEVDGNLEMVRLLRSQLRQKSGLRVLDVEALPLNEIAAQQVAESEPPAAAAAPDAPATPESPPASPPTAPGAPTTPAGAPAAPTAPAAPAAPDLSESTPPGQLPPIKEERDLEPYEKVFSNAEYWKKVGEEHQNPLIVTGSVLFMPHARSGFVSREQEVYDSFGRRRVIPDRVYMERKGFILRPTFVFIDGRTGETLHTETFREEILYNTNSSTPALSSFFELMDRLLPTFLNALSSQKIRGTRYLLK